MDKTPETNPNTSYDEWLGSAYTSETNRRFYYLTAIRRKHKTVVETMNFKRDQNVRNVENFWLNRQLCFGQACSLLITASLKQ